MADQSLDTEEMLDSNDNFEAAYEAHAKSIYNFLFWRTRDVQLSEDLTSRTFEKAWTGRQGFRGGSTKAWLHRIASNVLIDHWRKKKDLGLEDAELLPDETRPAMAELLDKQARIEQLSQALEKLPADMRAVVQQRFIEGLPSKEVAKRLELSESNVRVIQYRALKKLKAYLE
jgi:RNA polymerase sigma-70 factor (ECF subfamily)